jgi:hypothetical protein
LIADDSRDSSFKLSDDDDGVYQWDVESKLSSNRNTAGQGNAELVKNIVMDIPKYY